MVNYVHTEILTNTAVNGIALAVAVADDLYVATTGQIYATGTGGGAAIWGVSSANVTIAG